ncbi:hypothetical protein [Streptosporangium jomthongense]|uniref:Uncharacterized protein n=1 Tax=Streptosporangium jomthongense TaxID=1193683 RepID=A0ABV8EWV8_9ACTN
MTKRHDIVGYAEIIERVAADYGTDLGMDTVRSWEKARRAWDAKGRPTRSGARPREIPLPDPVTTVNGVPAWSWKQVSDWLITSGRVTPQE